MSRGACFRFLDKYKAGFRVQSDAYLIFEINLDNGDAETGAHKHRLGLVISAADDALSIRTPAGREHVRQNHRAMRGTLDGIDNHFSHDVLL